MTYVTIAIDAMGGDHGPEVTIPACLLALNKHPELKLVLVGKREILEDTLEKHHARENERLEIRHATQEVAMDELPSHALRSKKDSSMRIAIDVLKSGKAQACVSAGNTGALMATARFVLKMLPGIDRPAIMASLPTIIPNREVRMLDLGANVDSSADNLYQFAVMGSVVASAVENIAFPKVALLNIGEEEMKGNDQVKRTAHLLSESKIINYVGYIEGDAIFSGDVDVVVCDGFVGNISLKTAEGVVHMMTHFIRQAFGQNLLTKLVGYLARPLMRQINRAVDPGRRNGASLLGLQGIVIKSHGHANAIAYANAIDEALRQIEKNVPERIHREVGIVFDELHLDKGTDAR